MPPNPTPIYRYIHVDNLRAVLMRAGLHAPTDVPKDGLPYKTIHNVDIQAQRGIRPIDCGPGGVNHNYVSFYFGPRTPMLYQLHTGHVRNYTEGQAPIIYLISTAQAISDAGLPFVFSNGHGISLNEPAFATPEANITAPTAIRPTGIQRGRPRDRPATTGHASCRKCLPHLIQFDVG